MLPQLFPCKASSGRCSTLHKPVSQCGWQEIQIGLTFSIQVFFNLLWDLSKDFQAVVMNVPIWRSQNKSVESERRYLLLAFGQKQSPVPLWECAKIPHCAIIHIPVGDLLHKAFPPLFLLRSSSNTNSLDLTVRRAINMRVRTSLKKRAMYVPHHWDLGHKWTHRSLWCGTSLVTENSSDVLVLTPRSPASKSGVLQKPTSRWSSSSSLLSCHTGATAAEQALCESLQSHSLLSCKVKACLATVAGNKGKAMLVRTNRSQHYR